MVVYQSLNSSAELYLNGWSGSFGILDKMHHCPGYFSQKIIVITSPFTAFSVGVFSYLVWWPKWKLRLIRQSMNKNAQNKYISAWFQFLKAQISSLIWEERKKNNSPLSFVLNVSNFLVSVLLSAHVNRFSVFRMQDFVI